MEALGRRPFRAAILGIAALLVLPVNAHATPLAGHNELTASSAGFVPVTLERDVVLNWESEDPDPRVRIEGASRYPAVILRRETPGGGRYEFTAIRYGEQPDEVGMSYMRSGSEESLGETDPEGLVLPAGEWRLYGIGDGTPLKISFDLPGYAGSQALYPTVPVPASLLDVPRLSEVAGGRNVSLGAFAALESDGVMHAYLKATAGTVLASNVELCLHREEDANPFAPGCSGFFPYTANADLQTAGWRADHSLGAHGFPAGTYGIGANLTTIGDVAEIAFTAAWVSFDPRPGTPIVDLPAAPVPPAPIPAASPAPAKPAAKRPARKRCRKGYVLRTTGKGKRRAKRCVRRKRARR